MDPIPEDYFHTFKLVKEEFESFKLEQDDLKRMVSILYQKNKMLINELREITLTKDRALSDKGIRDIEHNLSLAIAAKDTAILLWQEAMKQQEKLEDQLVGRKSLLETERGEVVSSIEQIKDQYQKGLMTLSAELSNCQSNLSNAKEELRNRCLELEQNRFALKNVKEELTSTQAQLSAVSLEKSELQEKLKCLQDTLSDKSNLFSITKKELDEVNSVNCELSLAVTDLKEKNKKLKHDISVFEKDAKESLFAAQEAVLQKKEMAYREEQYLKEIDMLRSSSGIDVQKVELKCNLKIKEIQEQNSENVKSLMAEIKELIKDNGEKQSLFEKVEREKKSLESKLELLSAETLNSFPSTGTISDDLCNRLISAEKARDEYELRIKLLQSDLEEARSNKKQDFKRFTEEKSILKERLANLSKELRQYLSDKISLSEELCTVKKRCQELEKQLTFKRTRQMQEISTIRNEADRKQESFGEMLHSVEEHYKTVCSELQTLLESQFKINKKWQKETDELISQSESKIIELCDTIAELQCQNTNLMTFIQKNSSYGRIISDH